jgi:hypothetical protein
MMDIHELIPKARYLANSVAAGEMLHVAAALEVVRAWLAAWDAQEEVRATTQSEVKE